VSTAIQAMLARRDWRDARFIASTMAMIAPASMIAAGGTGFLGVLTDDSFADNLSARVASVDRTVYGPDGGHHAAPEGLPVRLPRHSRGAAFRSQSAVIVSSNPARDVPSRRAFTLKVGLCSGGNAPAVNLGLHALQCSANCRSAQLPSFSTPSSQTGLVGAPGFLGWTGQTPSPHDCYPPIVSTTRKSRAAADHLGVGFDGFFPAGTARSWDGLRRAC